MALFFSLMCSLGIPRGGGWLSLPFFGTLEGMQHLFQRQPLIPKEVSVEAAGRVPQCDPFKPCPAPSFQRSSPHPSGRLLLWDISQLRFLSSCPTRRNNTKAERRKLDL